jgi:hypothetical protein
MTDWSEPVEIVVTRDRVRRFAAAIGEADRRYVDVEHARSLGHPDLPVPVTLPFTFESDDRDTLAFMQELGVDPLAVLHGEQTFDITEPLHAGDVVQLRSRVVTDTLRPDKGLRFIVRESDVQLKGRPAARMSATWVVRLQP